jgi:S-methylmethionine-dependent homocysteine/selenocysteine methylase
MYKDWNFADAAVEWVDNGVNIIGGCCRITAKEIAELVGKLEKL